MALSGDGFLQLGRHQRTLSFGGHGNGVSSGVMMEARSTKNMALIRRLWRSAITESKTGRRLIIRQTGGGRARGDLTGKHRSGDGSRGSGLARGRNCGGGGERVRDLKTRSASPIASSEWSRVPRSQRRLGVLSRRRVLIFYSLSSLNCMPCQQSVYVAL